MKCDELKRKYSDITGPYYGYNEVNEAIAELNAKLAEKDKEIESLKASHYAEMVDAGMRERRLRRALWLKRADDAKHLVVAYENYDYLDCQEMTIKQENARTWMTCKLRTAEEWVKVWKNVERKCIKKAEEYKLKENRHHKYKRCLAMAKACHEKSERMYCEASSLKGQNEILGKEPKDAVVEKFELWGAIASTHRKIWLALAEEPTWAKFLTLIHKEGK